MNRPLTKLQSTGEIEEWFEGNDKTRRENLLRDITNNDYIKNTLDLKGLKDIKLSYALIEELERCLENKGTLNIIKLLMGLGLKKI